MLIHDFIKFEQKKKKKKKKKKKEKKKKNLIPKRKFC